MSPSFSGDRTFKECKYSEHELQHKLNKFITKTLCFLYYCLSNTIQDFLSSSILIVLSFQQHKYDVLITVNYSSHLKVCFFNEK